MSFARRLPFLLPLLLSAAQAAQPLSDEQAYNIADQYLAQMTLAEKVTITHGNSLYRNGGVPRLGIPDFYPSDGPCAVRPELNNAGHYIFAGKTTDCSTALPTLATLANTWDPSLAHLFGDTLGSEIRARGKDMSLGPGMNIMRTPICGRTFEYMGEDPFLTSRMGVELVRGVQENDVSACVKHFALNNQELNRDSVNVEVSDRALREIYLPAFEATVKEAHAWGLMGAYNKFRGDWCCENEALLKGVLRGEWGYKGVVVSDWGAIHNTVRAIHAGTDMDSGNSHHYDALVNLVPSGAVSESSVNDAARNMLAMMARIRLIGPETAVRSKGEINTPAHAAAARRIAQEAVVLLKNDAATLPLNAASLRTLLIVGKAAKARHCVAVDTAGECNLNLAGGSGEAKPLYETTAFEGIQKRLGGKVNIRFVDASEGGFEPLSASVLQGGAWSGEYFNFSGANAVSAAEVLAGGASASKYLAEAAPQGKPVAARRDANLGFDWKGAAPLAGVNAQNFSARWTAKITAPETGDYTFRLKADDGCRLAVDGVTLIDAWRVGPATPFTGNIRLEAGKTYTVKVEYFQGAGNSSIALDWLTPSSPTNLRGPAMAKLARSADAVLIFTGNTHADEQEGKDRGDITLPDGQDAMVEALAGINPKTVVVNQSGAPVAMPWVGKVPAILHYGFSGQEAGDALAAILFGDACPSGKLPCTFPKALADTPAHALKNYAAGRVGYAEDIFVGYRWFEAKKIEPLFPFGYGLSYTTFEIGRPEVASSEVRNGDPVKVRVTLKNTGNRAGAEVVQLYVGERNPGVPRPPKELKGFQKVHLRPGESRVVEFTLTPRDFSFWDVLSHGWKANPGVFDITVGNSSADTKNTAAVTLRP